jgi:radical SAM superfamily enzyme YgiQ (UPF0313 family)
MHILLIEQLQTKETTYKPLEKILLTSFSILPTLYVRRISAITPKEHQVTILNERYLPLDLTKNYDLVVIHFTTAQSLKAYEVADTFRSKNIPVVLCGLHATALPDEGLEHADSILCGRGEANWLSLLKDAKKNSLKKIYPVEPYENLPIQIPPTNVNLPGFQLIGAIEATRGCPYSCDFCPESNTEKGSFYFKRPVNEIIEEIKSLPQKFFMFYDTSLTVDPVFTKELFTKMIPLKKKFFCNGNVDVLSKDEDLVALSKKAGCNGWLIGFESISQETIQQIKKYTNMVTVYKQTIDLIHKYKMMVIGDFMFGFDTDTPDVFMKTVNAIQNLGIDVADFTIATPFPGTPYFNHLEQDGRIITRDWSKYNMYSVVYEPKLMTKNELQMGIGQVYHEFYSPKNTLIRVARAFRLGWYPFFSVINRNLISLFASLKLSNKPEA